jgi:hypothetical protein
MRSLTTLVCLIALSHCLGCASDQKTGSWEAAKADWRGDNMQMRGFSDMKPPDGQTPFIQPPK